MHWVCGVGGLPGRKCCNRIAPDVTGAEIGIVLFAAIGRIASSLGDFGQPMSPLSRLRTLLLRDVAPTVSTGEQTAEVRLVVFTKWGGFLRWTFTIDRNSPHRILDVKEEILVPYDCGVMF